MVIMGHSDFHTHISLRKPLRLDDSDVYRMDALPDTNQWYQSTEGTNYTMST